jgi:hypothetical protein
MIVYWCGWETNRVCFALLSASGALFVVVRRLSSAGEPLDLPGLRWLLPWLASLTIVSWLGNVGGGTGTLPQGVDLAVLAVSSLIVMRLSLIHPASRRPDG